MHSRSTLPLVIGLAGMLLGAAPARADVQLTIADGYVSLKATNATVREILAEWSRVGHTQIVNSEKIAGPPLTLQFTNEPEERALRTLLRSAGGYVAAPRAIHEANTSRFERILLMPAGPPPSRVAAPPPPPAFPQQPQFPPPTVADVDRREDREDLEPPPPAVVLPNPAREPVFQTYPQPSGDTPPPPPPAGVPVGSAVPGMVVPAPQTQPGQPSGRPSTPDDR